MACILKTIKDKNIIGNPAKHIDGCPVIDCYVEPELVKRDNKTEPI